MKHPISMPGSKARIIAELWPHMPKSSTGRVIVPFFGTGADSTFFRARGLHVRGSDAQPQLVRMHNNIISCHTWAEEWLRIHDWPARVPRICYATLREHHNENPRPESFYLLTRLGFNKLVRHNRKGGFNVPVGDLRPVPLPLRSAIVEHAKAIAGIDGVHCEPFPKALACAEPGDLRYLDPPYLGTFDGYTGRPFDHDGLFEALEDLTSQNQPWACSNSLAAEPRMPARATIHYVDRSGCFNSRGDSRGKVKEILATFTPT